MRLIIAWLIIPDPLLHFKTVGVCPECVVVVKAIVHLKINSNVLALIVVDVD